MRERTQDTLSKRIQKLWSEMDIAYTRGHSQFVEGSHIALFINRPTGDKDSLAEFALTLWDLQNDASDADAGLMVIDTEEGMQLVTESFTWAKRMAALLLYRQIDIKIGESLVLGDDYLSSAKVLQFGWAAGN